MPNVVTSIRNRWRDGGLRGIGGALEDLVGLTGKYRRHPRSAQESQSSISDVDWYLDSCRRATQSNWRFGRFRRDYWYRSILEHVTRDQGQAYIAEMYDLGMTDLQIRALLGRDKVGAPRRQRYPRIGLVSPTGLRYAKVSADLQTQFGSLDGLSIAEIGVGYGGQCRSVGHFARPAMYYLYDLPVVLTLAKRYLRASSCPIPVEFLDGREPECRRADLVISNYAFSELTGALQRKYLEAVILGSERGYITYNDISPAHFGSMSLRDLLRELPYAQLLEERPQTHPGNCIVVWGSSR